MNINNEQISNSAQNHVMNEEAMIKSILHSNNSTRYISKYLKFTIFFIILILIWILFMKINNSIVLEGKVISKSDIVKIINPFYAKVEKIHVENNQYVNKGDILLTLNSKEIVIQLKKKRNSLKSINSQIYESIQYLESSLTVMPQIQTFDKIRNFLADMNVDKNLVKNTELFETMPNRDLQQLIDRNNIEISTLKKEVLIIIEQLKYLDEQRQLFADSIKTNNTSKIDSLNYEIKYREGLIKLTKSKGAYDLKIAEALESESKKINKIAEDTRLKYDELLNLMEQKHQLIADIIELSNNDKNPFVVAPATGIIKNFNLTEGDILNNDLEILSIEPSNTEVILSSSISGIQRNMITQSNAVEVQFDNFNILDNKLKAKIISIEQINDEKIQKSGTYKITFSLDLPQDDSSFTAESIKAGMDGTIYIHTGTQTLINYLYDPIHNLIFN